MNFLLRFIFRRRRNTDVEVVRPFVKAAKSTEKNGWYSKGIIIKTAINNRSIVHSGFAFSPLFSTFSSRSTL